MVPTRKPAAKQEFHRTWLSINDLPGSLARVRDTAQVSFFWPVIRVLQFGLLVLQAAGFEVEVHLSKPSK